jgi:hypothetical protein
MLTVYADESTDEKEERVFAVGGVIAKQEEWDEFLVKWLEITEGTPFHSSDCETGHGSYEGWPLKRRRKLYADLVKLVVGKNPLLGIGGVVNLKEFWEAFPSVNRDSPYFLCFQDIVVNFALLTHLVVPIDQVDFVFDRSQRYQYNATILFEKFNKMPEWYDRFRLNEIRFASKDTTPGLQVADLVARESFKHLDNQLSSKRLPRLPMRALGTSQKFRFRFWIKEDFDAMHRDMSHFGWDENEIAGFASRGLLRSLGRLSE